MNRRLAIQFPEKRNALVFVLGKDPVDEVEPFAPLDRPFRISQLVLVTALGGPRTDGRLGGGKLQDHPLPEGTLGWILDMPLRRDPVVREAFMN